MLSNLSIVPPVKAKLLPDNIGTLRPHAANAGASAMDILSPTPPVLCLSTSISLHSGFQLNTSPEKK